MERTPNAAFVGSLVLVEPQQGAEGEEGAPGLELPVSWRRRVGAAGGGKASWAWECSRVCRGSEERSGEAQERVHQVDQGK